MRIRSASAMVVRGRIRGPVPVPAREVVWDHCAIGEAMRRLLVLIGGLWRAASDWIGLRIDDRKMVPDRRTVVHRCLTVSAGFSNDLPRV